MPPHQESTAELLLKLPWWVNASRGLLAFGLLRWRLPIWAGQDHIRQRLATGLSPLAPLALLLFGSFALGSFVVARKRRRLVDEQTSLDQLRATSWKDFEFLEPVPVLTIYTAEGLRRVSALKNPRPVLRQESRFRRQ